MARFFKEEHNMFEYDQSLFEFMNDFSEHADDIDTLDRLYAVLRKMLDYSFYEAADLIIPNSRVD